MAKIFLRDVISLFRESGVPSPEHDAREIFSEIGGVRRHLLINSDLSIESDAVEDAVRRRAAREPLQYIIGKVGFYLEEYKVTPACLIPRADTELLVDYAVKHIPKGETFLDLCTGSGAIAISTLLHTKNTSAVATDLSADALSVAEENANTLGVSGRVTLLQHDVLTDEPPIGNIGQPFAVLSNPPYVTSASYAHLEPEIYSEPESAFVGGEDGCDFYRAITRVYKNVIKKEGFIAYEIGYDQAELIRSIAGENGMSCEILRDLSSLPRVAVLKL